MWKYLAGTAAAASLAGAGIYWWTGSDASPAGAATRTPAGAAAQAGEPLAAPPAAEPGSREARRFARYDADRSGQVSRDEYLSSRTKAFGRLDADRDGKLSFDEWSRRTTDRFAKADNDRDGSLDAGEFATTRPVRRTRTRADCPPPREEDQG
jgi:hypothetical protein